MARVGATGILGCVIWYLTAKHLPIEWLEICIISILIFFISRAVKEHFWWKGWEARWKRHEEESSFDSAEDTEAD